MRRYATAVEEQAEKRDFTQVRKAVENEFE